MLKGNEVRDIIASIQRDKSITPERAIKLGVLGLWQLIAELDEIRYLFRTQVKGESSTENE